jgi:hypothetical protein
VENAFLMGCITLSPMARTSAEVVSTSRGSKH